MLLSIHRERHPDLKDDLRKFKTMLTDSSTELAPLKVWQLQGKATKTIDNIKTARIKGQPTH